MKTILLMVCLVSLVSCGKSDEAEFKSLHERLEQSESSNQYLRYELSVVKSNCIPSPSNPYIVVNSDYNVKPSKTKFKGCLEFKSHLSNKNILLSEESWKFCDRFERKEE